MRRDDGHAVTTPEILCVGEILWDALPAGLFLGGAPFNVACHLRAAGWAVSMVSRIGDDRLGHEALRRAAWYGVGTDLVQIDPELPTGFVRVTIDDAGNADYDILEPAAWDAIAATDELLDRAGRARAIVYGSLAQRHVTSRTTIERLWKSESLMVFDANLRPPYDDQEIVRRCLHHAEVVKVTEGELARIAEWFALGRELRARTTALAEEFGCETVCVTRGQNGAALWRDGRWTEEAGYEVEVRDTVGAGDAFLALLLAGLLEGADDRVLLRNANLIGAYVATQLGAVPLDQPAAISPPFPAGAARGKRRR
jgi:fructokinase